VKPWSNRARKAVERGELNELWAKPESAEERRVLLAKVRNERAGAADHVVGPRRMQKRFTEEVEMSTSVAPGIMDKKALKKLKKQAKKAARKEVRREAAASLGMTVAEYKAATAVEKLKRAREAGANPETIAKLTKRATERVDALARKLGLPVSAAPAQAAPLAAAPASAPLSKTVIGPEILGAVRPENDPNAAQAEVAKSLANPHVGDGWRP